MIFGWYQQRGHFPAPEDAPPAQFSAGRAFVVLERLLTAEQTPHPIGSGELQQFRTRLLNELEQLGASIEKQSQSVRGVDCVNLIARLPLESPPGARPLILTAHYDSAPGAPGAGDDGSGLVALIETGRALLHGPKDLLHPVYLLFTDGEEGGLLGAKGFVDHHWLVREKPIVLNFDARGTSGCSLMFETSQQNLQLVRRVVQNLPPPVGTGSAFVSVYRNMPNGTDFSEFLRVGAPGLNFAFIGNVRNYHRSGDRREALSPFSVQHQGDNALAASQVLAAMDWEQLDAADDAVFGDVLGLFVISCSERWAVPISLFSLVAIGWFSRRQLATRRFWNAGLRWCMANLLTLAAAVAMGFLLNWAFRSAKIAVPWDEIDWLCFLAFWVIAVAIARGILNGLTVQLSVDESSRWNWLLFASCGLLVAWRIPGMSYFFLVPLIVCSGLSSLPLAAHWRHFIGATITAIFVLPMVPLLDQAIRASSPQILIPLHVLAISPYFPQLRTGASHSRLDPSTD